MYYGILKYPRIRGLRENRDLNQQDIAEYLSINRNTYSCYERDVRNMPVEVFIKLALYYGTSVDYLVGLTDNKNAYKRGGAFSLIDIIWILWYNHSKGW